METENIILTGSDGNPLKDKKPVLIFGPYLIVKNDQKGKYKPQQQYQFTPKKKLEKPIIARYELQSLIYTNKDMQEFTEWLTKNREAYIQARTTGLSYKSLTDAKKAIQKLFLPASDLPKNIHYIVGEQSPYYQLDYILKAKQNAYTDLKLIWDKS